MTFAAACGWSLLRSILIAAVGVWAAVHVAQLLQSSSGRLRAVVWAFVLLPFFTPGLIVGYGYRNYSLSLVHYPLWNEVLYAAIVLFQAVPVGALLVYFAPSPALSETAIHCRRLLLRNAELSLWNRMRSHMLLALDQLRGPKQSTLAAAAVIFLVAFQETEVAALMQVRGWPEWLFTRYAGLVDLSGTRNRLLILVAIQGAVVLPVAVWMLRRASDPTRPSGAPLARGGGGWWLWPPAGCVLVTIIPAVVVLNGAWDGLPALRQRAFWTELAYGLAYAGTCGGLAFAIAGSLIAGCRSDGSGTRARYRASEVPDRQSPLPDLWSAFVGLAVLPGLCGSMTLALLIDVLFQQSWLLPAYDSPARMLVALTLFLLPRAVLVNLCLGLHRSTTGLHAARLLSGGAAEQRRSAAELAWRLRGQPRFWGLILVGFWGYLDLMIATISAPPGMEPVVKRLYNQMHFGHIAGLSAMVCATVAVPFLLVAFAWMVRRFVAARVMVG